MGKTTMKIIDLGEGRMVSHINIEGHPELSCCCICKEGIDNHVNVPHMGGKCVITFNKCGNGYKSVIKSEAMGTWEMEEEFTEAGIKCVVYKSGNGIKEYMKKAGYPEAIAAHIEDYKMAIKACDTGLKVWESWGEVCLHSNASLMKKPVTKCL